MKLSRRWLWCLPMGAWLLASSAMGQEPTPEATQKEAVAESIVAREEALSGRAFEPVFRARVTELLATLPLAELASQTGEDGLGLSSLGDSQADLVYTPVTPCRIIDTRIAGGAITAGATRNFLVTGTNYSAQGGKATGCGVPYGPTTAAVVNFVAVNPAGAGNLRVTPFDTTMPLASIINFSAKVNLANGLVVATCNPSSATCSSDITIQADVSATQLVADVQGYYQRVATGGVGTALLADAAVTAPKIGSGVVVRSLNSQTDAVTLAGANGLGVTQGSGTVTLSSNATAANTASTIVARDGSGNFSAGSVSLAGNLALPDTTSATVGVLNMGGTSFLHNYGNYNTFVGSGAGNLTLEAATGEGANSSFGFQALHSITSGTANSGFGFLALYLNTTGTHNSAFGTEALLSNTTASYNSAFGEFALHENTTGSANSAFGLRALAESTTASYNSAFGNYALESNTTGPNNSAFGDQALLSNTIGEDNSAFGNGALYSNTTGSYNSAFGEGALHSSTIADQNTAFGSGALFGLSTGNQNIAVGQAAGASLTSGSNNIYIGNMGASPESNTIRIGSNQTATYIAGIYGATTAGSAVYVASDGRLGTTPSSRRYKEQIVDMSVESDVLMKLRPVSFYYRQELDDTHLRQYGLVAEEVAEVAPGLVAYDEDGVPQTVRYHFVNAMLLNEVQKQRRQLEAQDRQLRAQGDQLRSQEAEIRGLRARESKIQALEARLAKLEAGGR
jgi:hypothetical protein